MTKFNDFSRITTVDKNLKKKGKNKKKLREKKND